MGQNVQQKLKEGDWLIVATDGLYDNIADADLVNMCMTAEDAQVLADEMGDTASAKSVDTNYRSPFMAAAEKAGVQWKGGKADDITVVAARILRDDNMTATSLLSTLPEVAEVSE